MCTHLHTNTHTYVYVLHMHARTPHTLAHTETRTHTPADIGPDQPGYVQGLLSPHGSTEQGQTHEIHRTIQPHYGRSHRCMHTMLKYYHVPTVCTVSILLLRLYNLVVQLARFFGIYIYLCLSRRCTYRNVLRTVYTSKYALVG